MSGFFCVFFFTVGEFRWGVIVRFVDIGGSVDHHLLSFLFIIITMVHEFNTYIFFYKKIGNAEENKCDIKSR